MYSLRTWPTAGRQLLPRRSCLQFDRHILPCLTQANLQQRGRHQSLPCIFSQRQTDSSWSLALWDTTPHITPIPFVSLCPLAQFPCYSWGCDDTFTALENLYTPGRTEDWVADLVSLRWSPGRLVSQFLEDLTCKPRLHNPCIGLASAPQWSNVVAQRPPGKQHKVLGGLQNDIVVRV